MTKSEKAKYTGAMERYVIIMPKDVKSALEREAKEIAAKTGDRPSTSALVRQILTQYVRGRK